MALTRARLRNMADQTTTPCSAGNIAASLTNQQPHTTSPKPSDSIAASPAVPSVSENSKSNPQSNFQSLNKNSAPEGISFGNFQLPWRPGSLQLPQHFTMPEIPPIIPHPDKADNATISHALNSMIVLLRENLYFSSVNLSEITGRVQSLESKVDHVLERQKESETSSLHKQNAINSRINDQAQKIEELGRNQVSLADYNSLKADFDRFTEAVEERLQSVSNEMLNLKLDNIRVATDTSKLEERVNVHDLRAKKHSFIIEGFPESVNENVAQNLVTRLNSDTGANFRVEDFRSIRRVGKTEPSAKTTGPRPVAVVVNSDDIRSNLLNCRGHLSKNNDGTFLWLNEELPPAYRRRKSMLRDLVKLATTKGHTAKIDSGGINLDGILYTPDCFGELPVDLQPQVTRLFPNSKGNLIFSGEYAYLSNMYRCDFTHNYIHFTSGEQCFQFLKAQFHKDDYRTQRILSTNDPFECKKIGDKIERSKPWAKVQEEK